MGYKNALDRYIEATNSHDFSNVGKWVDSNAVYWFSDKTCTTPEEIQRYFENAWETVKEEKYSVTDVVWIAEDENSAACIYTYHWEGFIDGRYGSGKGRGTNVLVKRNDGWKIVHEHLSRQVA
ncbi:nuclear transport factor 2 family protein [Paenibacillus dendritiformis]|uniref:YybH family protein n=1 Tax=Paenibacillus dendritiformis TaxID=130049 RepID=UPI00364F0D48